jgi:hypothetical protein
MKDEENQTNHHLCRTDPGATTDACSCDFAVTPEANSAGRVLENHNELNERATTMAKPHSIALGHERSFSRFAMGIVL